MQKLHLKQLIKLFLSSLRNETLNLLYDFYSIAIQWEQKNLSNIAMIEPTTRQGLFQL